MSEPNAATEKALIWARENLKDGLLGPFLGTCLTASLLKIQQDRPEILEDALQSFWGVIDKTILEGIFEGTKGKPGITNLTQIAVYLALNDYFCFKGNFKQSIDRSMQMFKTFGESNPKLKEVIDTLGVELMEEFVNILTKHRAKK